MMITNIYYLILLLMVDIMFMILMENYYLIQIQIKIIQNIIINYIIIEIYLLVEKIQQIYMN
jgi:hypothetical protein